MSTSTVTGARRRLAIRVALLALAIGQGSAAIWARLAPRGFYEDFPGAGQQWVAALPPFNEHLVTDYGSAFLALSLLVAIAAVLLERRLVAIAMACWLTAAAPHFLFHLATPGNEQPGERLASLVSLAITVGVPLLVLAGLRGGRGRADAAAGPAP